jgi:mannose-6-phosphate isomerase-like protein (cupin superfamily)
MTAQISFRPDASESPVFSKRAWGHFERIAMGDRFKVTQVTVRPGGKLSLQSHMHRAEHWVVVAGTATVTIDETRAMIGESQSVFIPLGAVHRLENEGRIPLVLIAVHTGIYLGEDDIRHHDDPPALLPAPDAA